ncbi:hypothetical protein [Lysobacter tyrosinilyticus]
MKRLMISLLGALAFTAAAQTTPQQTTPATDAPATAQTEAKKPDINDAYCLRETGTRITRRTERVDHRKSKSHSCVNSFGRAYTREDLDRTGEINIADALRRLDPSIH